MSDGVAIDLVLYANGCSMTYGYELIDDPETHVCLDDTYRETHAWPSRLAAKLGCSRVINESIPGGSNDRILRTTISWVLNFLATEGEVERRRLLVVVGWSDPMRREYFIDGAWKQAIPYHDYPNEPSFNRLNIAYREAAWNDHESACRFATQLLALQAFLQRHGIRFLFFDALKSCQEIFAAARDEVAHVRAVDPRTYFNFAHSAGSMASILSWATPNWKGRHPAEDGHEYWAALLADHLQKQSLLDTIVPLTVVEPPGVARVNWLDRLRRKLYARRARKREPLIYP
jgi:lysophospholipase L1-like esterase